MDFGGNTFCLNNNINNREEKENSTTTTSNSNNSHTHSFPWESSCSWQITTTPSFINPNHSTAANRHEASLANAIMFLPQASSSTNAQTNGGFNRRRSYGGDVSHMHLDPHLTCLKLGKRHYFEDGSEGGVVVGLHKRSGWKGYRTSSSRVQTPSFTVPRCQVEGCHVALLNAKDYHRRHKVCEMHSKAPKVVVLGTEQRFCQQCSRFHAVSEFDDSKRSCRRRLAGHNERRRKSSHDNSVIAASNSSQGCALSLLSSGSDSWLSPADLSIRCSAALRELIAENRVALMARQLVSDRDHHDHDHDHAAVEEEFKEHIQQKSSNYLPQQMFPET